MAIIQNWHSETDLTASIQLLAATIDRNHLKIQQLKFMSKNYLEATFGL